MIKRPGAPTIIIIAVVAVIAAALVIARMNSAPPTPEPTPSSSARPTAFLTPPAPGSSAPTPVVAEPRAGSPAEVPQGWPDGLSAVHEKAINDFISSYFSQSSTDPSEIAWLDRAAPTMTPGFANSIREVLGGNTGGQAWNEFVDAKSVRSARIESMAALDLSGFPQGKVIYRVTYTTTVTSEATVGKPVVDRPQSRMVELTKVEGKWLVNSFDSLAGGS